MQRENTNWSDVTECYNNCFVLQENNQYFIICKGDKIYVGVCVDTAFTLGVCTERNAIFNMITNGEDAIKRVIVIDRDMKSIYNKIKI